MIITIDYDNNCVRLKKRNKSFTDDITIPIKRDLGDIQLLLTETINMICSEYEHLNIVLDKQDDGSITTIEEY